MYIISDYNCEINCINWSAGTKDIEKKWQRFGTGVQGTITSTGLP